jgi:hypothetical protein
LAMSNALPLPFEPGGGGTLNTSSGRVLVCESILGLSAFRIISTEGMRFMTLRAF